MRLVLFPGGMETSDEAKLMVLDEPSLSGVRNVEAAVQRREHRHGKGSASGSEKGERRLWERPRSFATQNATTKLHGQAGPCRKSRQGDGHGSLKIAIDYRGKRRGQSKDDNLVHTQRALILDCDKRPKLRVNIRIIAAESALPTRSIDGLRLEE